MKRRQYPGRGKRGAARNSRKQKRKKEENSGSRLVELTELPVEVTLSDVATYCNSFGPLLSISMRTVQFNNRKSAYCSFVNVSDATNLYHKSKQQAVIFLGPFSSSLPSSIQFFAHVLPILGHHIHVQLATHVPIPSKLLELVERGASRNLFVCNLASTVTEKGLLDFFLQHLRYDDVESIYLHHEYRTAYLNTTSVERAVHCRAQLNGSIFHGCRIDIMYTPERIIDHASVPSLIAHPHPPVSAPSRPQNPPNPIYPTSQLSHPIQHSRFHPAAYPRPERPLLQSEHFPPNPLLSPPCAPESTNPPSILYPEQQSYHPLPFHSVLQRSPSFHVQQQQHLSDASSFVFHPPISSTSSPYPSERRQQIQHRPPFPLPLKHPHQSPQPQQKSCHFLPPRLKKLNPSIHTSTHKIYLLDIPVDTTYSEVCDIANNCSLGGGNINSVVIDNQQHIACVDFVDDTVAQRVLHQYYNRISTSQPGISIRGRFIQLSTAPNDEPIQASLRTAIDAGLSRSIVANHLAPTVCEEMLKCLFSAFGDVEKVTYWKNLCLAYINMCTIQSAWRAISKLNGTELKGCLLSLSSHKDESNHQCPLLS